MLKLNTNSITLFGEIIFERRRLSRKQQRRYRNALYLIVSDHPHWTLIATRRLGHLPIILRLQLHLDSKKIQELVLTHLWKCFFKVREDIKKKVLCSFRHFPNWRGGGGVWPCSIFFGVLAFLVKKSSLFLPRCKCFKLCCLYLPHIPTSPQKICLSLLSLDFWGQSCLNWGQAGGG